MDKEKNLDTAFSDIPKCLQKFIEQCSKKEADELWFYFDGCLVTNLMDFIVTVHQLE